MNSFTCNGAVGTPTRSFVRSFTKRRCLRFQRTFAVTAATRRADAPKARASGTDYVERVRSLSEGGDLARWYPRSREAQLHERALSPSQFVEGFAERLAPGDVANDMPTILAGRVKARRSAGSKLVFFDVEASSVHGTPVGVQVVCNRSTIEAVDAEDFKDACQRIRAGDLIEIQGYPHRTKTGQLSILAARLPMLQAPMLHQLPDNSAEAESVNRRFHVKMLIQPSIREVLRLRMLIEDELDSHCKSQGMTRVRTPIIGAASGGAAADPFETRAKELADDRLSLRISPELYLKRLIVGDMHGVYEIGPSFRNEGVDATHNPEFTTCEYYQRHATLPKLMRDTEELLQRLSNKLQTWAQDVKVSIEPPIVGFESPFPVISFIPHLESVLRTALGDANLTLPNFEQPGAAQFLQDLYSRLGIPVPSDPTLPRLLDDLSGHYIEPECTNPTWIVNQPACLAPLAKSFIDEQNGQHVSARAELFIGHREYVNCYEEENNPCEQRKKFIQQQMLQGRATTVDAANTPAHAAAADHTITLPGIEESYIEALEWGLPPTGGWGCGVDRLVMLFAGVDRIADVLPFGTLRNVVAMGKPLRR